MAKFNGANLRYDNSDEAGRVYDISAEVVVENNKAEAVQNISVLKDGMSVAYGSICGIGSEAPNSNFNFSVAHTEIKAVTDAMIDFAAGLVTKAENEASEN